MQEGRQLLKHMELVFEIMDEAQHLKKQFIRPQTETQLNQEFSINSQQQFRM